MANQKINNFLIPNVTKILPKSVAESSNTLAKGEVSDFKNLLDGKLEQLDAPVAETSKGIHLSTHAMRRLQERNLSIDKDEYLKLQSAIDKLKIKGGRDSLIVTGKAAYIVDVANNTIVTAIDKENIEENVFTKIDSTILMN